MMKTSVLAAVSLSFATGRFFVPTHELSKAGTYEAFAHLFVGGLVGAWLATREMCYLWLALALSAVELTAFLMTR
jgi:hypothetical protein